MQTQWKRGLHPALLLTLLGLTAAGCATKRDIRTLQDEMTSLERQQAATLQALERQTALLIDTLNRGFDVQRDLRGETSHRFGQLEQNLSRLEEMLNQTQLVVAQLLERLERAPAISSGGGVDPAMGGVPGAAEELYRQGMQFLESGSYATARMAFEQIVTSHPNDPRAADAQYGLAESYAGEGDVEQAITAFEAVERQWPRSSRAPTALLRAGIVAQESGRADRARAFYEQVRQRYPNTDEFQEAQRRLRTLR